MNNQFWNNEHLLYALAVNSIWPILEKESMEKWATVLQVSVDDLQKLYVRASREINEYHQRQGLRFSIAADGNEVTIPRSITRLYVDVFSSSLDLLVHPKEQRVFSGHLDFIFTPEGVNIQALTNAFPDLASLPGDETVVGTLTLLYPELFYKILETVGLAKPATTPLQQWKDAVASDQTILGYEEWVENQIQWDLNEHNERLEQEA